MYTENINDYIKISDEAAEVFRKTLKKVENSELFAELADMIERNALPFDEIRKKCDEYAQKLDVHEYTFLMTVLFANIGIAEKRYLEKGIDRQVFLDTAEDLYYKTEECKKTHGVWGISVFLWYSFFFEARLFKLGRLEFVPEYRKDHLVIGVQIPSCGPLRHEEVMDSYKRAYNFFGGRAKEPMIFSCCSYLLFSPYKGAVFANGTNTYRFVDDFFIVRDVSKDVFADAWRIFGRPYDGDVSVLPKETSMQRSFAAYLEKGGVCGIGTGGFLFDGEKIEKQEQLLKSIL